MTDKVEAYTDNMRKTSGDLIGIAGRFQDLLTKLEGDDAAVHGKWGDDEFGNNFANGQYGYVSSYKNLHDNLKSKVDLLQSYAQGLSDGADTLDKQDENNGSDIASV
ncbi:uncharacterized protein YukE [Nocardia sp. GAS34]|uniref:hypothetical protein n=1 Tax=unclassified Nocardia TaxID=2637762 RepID=UPI003D1E6074